MRFGPAFAALLLSVLAAAQEVPECCQAAAKQFPDLVKLSTDPNFELPPYYSLQEAEIKPYCDFTAKNADHVSSIVKIASEHQCPFAVRSGGGMFWPGSSNIGGGVLINLSELLEVKLSSDKKVASVGPGVYFADLYPQLAPSGVFLAGGRMPKIGTGGYMAHGGISYLSYELGFASETIVNYEVVLADGSMVQANPATNPDLFWALKWGSTNFGIITRFDIATFPLPSQFFAGIIGYTNLSDSTQKDLTDKYVKFVDDHSFTKTDFALISWSKNTDLTGFVVGSLAGNEIPGSTFVPADVAQPVSDTSGVVPFDQFVKDSIVVVGTEAKRIAWYPVTVKPNTGLLLDIRKKVYDVCGTLEGHVKGFECIIVIQPFTKGFIEASKDAAVYDVLHEANDNLILVLVELQWDNGSDDAELDKAVADIQNYSEKTAKERNLFNSFVYPNYALGTQDFYRNSVSQPNLTKMQSIRTKYDPKNVFAKLWKGGYKLPQ
ncbi:hypothetical protein AAF712_012728 [Marasmius tenuissimus]|uniref:FAD-binding PCMH-type domain-containing protein n=1 Tax=Marasmius tenuissimus TaxID=585030 RepID=A0ABR2ZFR0_9AGAR|nr:hypothetical protein PM082_011206 [Marasmius tenuissimus]